MGVVTHVAMGGAVVTVKGRGRVCPRKKRWGGILLSLFLMQGCTDFEEVVMSNQALVTEAVDLLVSFDDPLFSWDTRIDGVVSLPYSQVTLRSDVDGRVWSGEGDAEGAWSFRGAMSPGEHTLVFEVRSEFGHVADFTHDVSVRDNEDPLCSIQSPLDGASYAQGEAIDFIADNADPDDDPLLHLWTSDLEGGLIEGEEWSMVLSLSGQHLIQLDAFDSFGGLCSDTVTIQVE